MKKILRYSFVILMGFAAFLSSCTETEPTDPNQQLLANKDWYTDGLYFGVNASDGSGGTKVLAPNLRFRFSKTNSVNTTAVNGQNLGAAAIWTLSVDGKTLTVYYPTIAGGGATLTSQALKVVKLSATELWVTTPTQEDIQLFGIINLSPTSNYRFTTTANTNTAVTDANLTGVTWKGSGSTSAGIFTSVGGGAFTKQSDANITFAFKQFYGINYLTVGGIPTPSTWTLNDAKTQLTIAYPKTGATAAGYFTMDIAKLTGTELWLASTTQLNLYNIVTLPASGQLRMIPQ